jgi:hypothetical protein
MPLKHAQTILLTLFLTIIFFIPYKMDSQVLFIKLPVLLSGLLSVLIFFLSLSDLQRKYDNDSLIYPVLGVSVLAIIILMFIVIMGVIPESMNAIYPYIGVFNCIAYYAYLIADY